MQTKQVTAAELHDPEDRGSYVKKGSLVRRGGATWRVHKIERSETLNVTLVEKRPEDGPGSPTQLSGPRTKTCSVLPNAPFEEVIQ